MGHVYDPAARKYTQGAVRVCPNLIIYWYLVPVLNIVPDCQNTQEYVTCLSNVAGVGSQANQTEECNSRSPIILYMWKRALTMEFLDTGRRF